MKYRCKVYWEMCGKVEVEADTPEQAAEKAMASPLPKENQDYVPDSINCDPETDVQERHET